MSGIFGAVSKNLIQADNYKGLITWNENYGDQELQRYENNHLIMGIKPEFLKETSETERLFGKQDEKVIGVVDALIYSEKENDHSDEYYLFSRVRSLGIDSLKEVNGDFAGAIWDEHKKKLTLFRDHMGVRPLFYYTDNERVIFSTDIRGILSVKDIDASVNEKWLYLRLSGSYDLTPDETEYTNVKCVPFGGFVSFDFNNEHVQITEGRYYIPGQKKYRLKGRKAYEKELRQLIEDAVAIRANATKMPLGAELSGGLDSSVIGILLKRMGKECTYCSWSPGEDELSIAENDERLIIKDICKENGITCNFGNLSVDFNKHTLLKDRFPIGIENYAKDHVTIKYAFPLYVNTLPIYEAASFMRSKGVKLIFSGHGGDEGVSHRSNPYELVHYHEYYRYLRLMYSRSSVSKHRIIKTLQLIKENLKIANTQLKKPFYSNYVDSKVLKEDFSSKYRGKLETPLYFAFDPYKYILSGGSRNRLDNLSFYSGCVGVRYLIPYLDYRVLDFALGIPRYLYHNWYYDRFIFREAFKDIMPASLYKHKLKEETSYRNRAPRDEDSLEQKRKGESNIEYRLNLISYLDKEYWQQYLDFDKLSQWAHGEVPLNEDGNIARAVSACMQAEHLVKRAREVNE